MQIQLVPLSLSARVYELVYTYCTTSREKSPKGIGPAVELHSASSELEGLVLHASKGGPVINERSKIIYV
jgi:hypothetical protein